MSFDILGVNVTTRWLALGPGKPCIALSRPTYNMPRIYRTTSNRDRVPRLNVGMKQRDVVLGVVGV